MRLALFGSEARFCLELGQVNSHCNGNPATRVEFHILHRADTVISALALVKGRPDLSAVFEQKIHLLGQAPPFLELHVANRRIVDLDQQRAPELAVTAKDLVVSLSCRMSDSFTIRSARTIS